MRHQLLACAALCLFATVVRAEEKSDTPQIVRFGEEQFELAYELETATNDMKEYLLPGESLKKWTKLVGIYKYPQIHDPRAFAEHMGEMVQAQNPRARSYVGFDPQTGEATIDFVTWPIDNKFVEFNLFKFKRDGANGIVAHQYAVRDYNDKNLFVKNLQQLRKESYKTMMQEGLVIEDAKGEAEVKSNTSARSQGETQQR